MPDPVSPAGRQGPDALLGPLREAIREAAALAMPFFNAGDQTSARVWSKAGGSPVTEADVAVDTFLKIRLSEIDPSAAWLSEETSDDPVRLNSDRVWIVDPIDGTRAFLSGHPDWSIAVALLERGQPLLGFVHAPALGIFYEAASGRGATRNGAGIAVSPRTALPGAGITGPKPMADRFVRGAGQDDFTRIPRVPSLALRVARVAEGAIDIGLVSRDSRDWDLAAADLILREAGGTVCTLDGAPAVYNRPEPKHGELIAVPNALKAATLKALAAG
ncbi:3'(2'),5'-bisphosphate nucleotidase CysQ [Methylobacterium organophilum]|uniref:3'(2'),5'-bisphosphate nucleotidase CysQ n=1 Tax=Methylobacterium organophilum TaxID=410 RepID=UPI001F143539|nr:3'(2'),5'-bisphosphate nucleotidase CysQ [Methylobacterium organophilum]UMY17877.1 3'(2'),5'-bisphosphate nucleotidase CysQ [Methylobacterium organophilum]